LLEQLVLPTLNAKLVELAADRVQVALEAAEFVERLVDLRLQGLGSLRKTCVHERSR
jgi:hypothetical protein